MIRKLQRLIMVTAIMSTIGSVGATALPDSIMNYNIVYHWGFIEKTAGHGSVKLKLEGDTLSGTLTGRSIPWSGRIYCVNDTLRTIVNNRDGVISQQVLYENGWYTKPLAADSLSTAPLTPADYKTIKGAGSLDADAATMEAITITADMIGFFYVVRLIDFNTITVGDSKTIAITNPDGSTKKLEITYNGTTNWRGLPAYQVVFNYTYDGTMSAYPVQVVIDAARRIPLTVSATLLVGHMEMIYAGK